MSDETSVWVTGIGAATALGSSYDAIADALLAGVSAVRKVDSFDVSDHPSQIAGKMDVIPCPVGWEQSEFRNLAPLEQLILWCCSGALRDAGHWDNRETLRIGIAIGLGAEWLEVWEADSYNGGNRVCDPSQNPESLVEAAVQKLHLSGPGASVSAACASGNYALAQARRWLQLDWVDVCLAGACGMAVSPLALAGFGNLRALSRRNGEPQLASRPFDRGRDGFVIGEGGAMFVLESAAHARRRTARAYAEVAGFGASSDAYNMVIPSPDPGPATAAMRKATHRRTSRSRRCRLRQCARDQHSRGRRRRGPRSASGVRACHRLGARQLDKEYDRTSSNRRSRGRSARLSCGHRPKRLASDDQPHRSRSGVQTLPCP